MRSTVPMLLAIALLAGCSKNPQDQQADALRKSAAVQAKQIRDQGELQAAGLDQQSKSLAAQAKQAGGYTGERLQVQADSLAKQADILRKQAKSQAEATEEAADAQAKQITSR